MLTCERCHAPLLKFAQSLFELNDVRVRFVNARRREFALIQEFLDNRNRFYRDVRIVMEVIRNCEHVHFAKNEKNAPGLRLCMRKRSLTCNIASTIVDDADLEMIPQRAQIALQRSYLYIGSGFLQATDRLLL